MEIKKLAELNEAERSAIVARTGIVDTKVKDGTAEILKEVEEGGEQAVLELTKKFDKVELEKLEIDDKELAAVDEKSAEFEFLRKAAANIEKVHQNQLNNISAEEKIEPEKGVEVWREWRPIQRVGIYAPGGLATYPSSVLMQAIPAKIAGCQEIVLATPPNKEGKVPDVVIAAAKLSGVTKIIKCGGAQAIGALAFVEKVQKITGPGNPWVTEAKAQLAAKVAIDMPAGPSEIMIIADDSAVPKFIAADLLSQAEHAADSSSILVTMSEQLAVEVAKEVEKQLEELGRKEIARTAIEERGEILIVNDLAELLEFANDYAPEHLEICTENPEKILEDIVNVGSVFLGNFASEAAGDFATGSNHVLPTAGFAKNFAPLSVESFGKKIQIQKLDKDGLGKIRETCEKFGEVEGLDAHAKSVSIRFEEDG